ncbi:MAG: OsmC family protein [Thermodesulfovibrionales bacterium]|nr:OsmC family protein [Thermodesulfovibrionales bacterium]
MADHDELQQSLTDYKQKVNPVVKATLQWDKDLIFVGRTNEGYEIEFDAKVQWGCKPTDALLLSLAGCMAIDVVMFLQKMKMKLATFSLKIEGERNPTPPQYFKKIDIVLLIGGKDIDKSKIERAVSLSHEKYCSVYHSLRKDLQVNVTYEIEEKEIA